MKGAESRSLTSQRFDGRRSLVSRRNSRVFIAATALVILCLLRGVSAAHAQEIAHCEGDDSIAELQSSIRTHNEHIFRLNRKFPEYWYFQGKVPEEVLLDGTLGDVERFLGELSNRRAAILFYGHRSPKFCTWLLWLDDESSSKKQEMPVIGPIDKVRRLSVIQEVRTLDDGNFDKFDSFRQGMQNRGLIASTGALSTEETASALSQSSDLLLPPRVSAALKALDIETLVVVPITIAKKDEQFASIGTVPYAALPIDGKPLIFRMSVIVAPGFYVFTESPKAPKTEFEEAIIVGDPDGTLPGARHEAESIAADLHTTPLIGSEATISAVVEKLRNQASTDLVHLATHGIADSENPLDDSYLMMHGGGKWTARQISKEKLKGQPLVVMSACQTGLGKDFGVGTIGLARAWQWAGARAVIMSLWNIDDTATRDLMRSFIRLSQNMPVDKALQRAMQLAYQVDVNPALWAGFSVFGTPEKSVIKRTGPASVHVQDDQCWSRLSNIMMYKVPE